MKQTYKHTSRVIATLLSLILIGLCVTLSACTKTPGTDSSESTQPSNSTENGVQTDESTEEKTGTEINDGTGGSQPGNSFNQGTERSGLPGTTTTSASPPATATTKGTTGSPAVPHSRIAYFQNIIDNEVEWLASMQLDNGALPMTNDTTTLTLNPYFSDFAALGILEGDAKYFPVVKRYIDWHCRYLNTAAEDRSGVDGTIYDYTAYVDSTKKNVERQEVVVKSGKKHYDSTDSYAATFLSVLYRYYERTGDKAYLESKYNDVKRVVNALFATMHNGLTMATPDYEVKYLMDNAEVYKGMDDAAKLFSAVYVSKFSDAPALAKKLSDGRDSVKNTIETKMWNSKGYYEAALSRSSTPSWNFKWKEFYPSATANISLISNGVLSADSARAKQLYASFNANHATNQAKYNWPGFSNEASFYWCTVVHTAALMNDTVNVDIFMKNYEKVMKRHIWPMYNAEAGHVIRACRAMIDNLQ